MPPENQTNPLTAEPTFSDAVVRAYARARSMGEICFNGSPGAPRPVRAPLLPCVRLHEFLVHHEIEALRSFTLATQPGFEKASVIADNVSLLDEQRRRSAVLFNLGGIDTLFRGRVLHVLPYVCERLAVPMFEPRHVEVQLTATPDRGFFSAHDDNSSEPVRSRRVTFVYYFTLGPTLYTGGSLHFLNRVNGGDATIQHTVAPQHNMMVCFPSEILHEVTQVRCSADFASNRFTVNGWIHG